MGSTFLTRKQGKEGQGRGDSGRGLSSAKAQGDRGGLWRNTSPSKL